MYASILFVLLMFSSLSHAAEVSLPEFLKRAWNQSPTLTAEQHSAEVSDEFIKSARGRYYPHVSLEALDTTGFPGSTSLLRVGGVMGSPYRSGATAGVIVEQTVYDFGRIQSLLDQAKAEKSLSEARLAEEKWRFITSLGRLYLACSRSRSMQAQIESLMSWEVLILKETSRFTKTGQRSVIDNALVKAEMDDLNLQRSELKKYEVSLSEQMSAYASTVNCKPLTTAGNGRLDSKLTIEEPSLLLAKAQAEVAKAQLSGAKASQMPHIDLMGSAGGMEKARLVPRDDYSAGVSIVFPVWDGGEDAHREQAMKSEVELQSDNLRAVSIEFANKLKSLRDSYDRSRDTLKELETNLDQMRATVKLASRRYRSLEGPLIDVRESYAQLKSLETQRVQLLYDLAETSFLLGVLHEN